MVLLSGAGRPLLKSRKQNKPLKSFFKDDGQTFKVVVIHFTFPGKLIFMNIKMLKVLFTYYVMLITHVTRISWTFFSENQNVCHACHVGHMCHKSPKIQAFYMSRMSRMSRASRGYFFQTIKMYVTHVTHVTGIVQTFFSDN